MRRREFITLFGAAAGWPLAAHSQQPAMPVVGFVHFGQQSDSGELAASFRRGVIESGFTEGRA